MNQFNILSPTFNLSLNTAKYKRMENLEESIVLEELQPFTKNLAQHLVTDEEASLTYENLENLEENQDE